MSKFTKRKNKSIQRYDKCPTMSLYQVATFLMKDANVSDKGVSSVHLVKDDEARLTVTASSCTKWRDSIDVYLTTKLLMLLLEEHAVNANKNYSDRAYYEVAHLNGETDKCRLPYAQRYYGRNSMGQKSISLICVDLLMYMKESGRIHIQVSSKNPLATKSSGRLGFYTETNTNLSIASTPCISRRLELTSVKNQLMEAHKDDTKTCNYIRENDSVDNLLNNYFRYPYGEKNKAGNRKWTSAFVSYYVELGGIIDPNFIAV